MHAAPLSATPMRVWRSQNCACSGEAATTRMNPPRPRREVPALLAPSLPADMPVVRTYELRTPSPPRRSTGDRYPINFLSGHRGAALLSGGGKRSLVRVVHAERIPPDLVQARD